MISRFFYFYENIHYLIFTFLYVKCNTVFVKSLNSSAFISEFALFHSTKILQNITTEYNEKMFVDDNTNFVTNTGIIISLWYKLKNSIF